MEEIITQLNPSIGIVRLSNSGNLSFKLQDTADYVEYDWSSRKWIKTDKFVFDSMGKEQSLYHFIPTNQIFKGDYVLIDNHIELVLKVEEEEGILYSTNPNERSNKNISINQICKSFYQIMGNNFKFKKLSSALDMLYRSNFSINNVAKLQYYIIKNKEPDKTYLDIMDDITKENKGRFIEQISTYSTDNWEKTLFLNEKKFSFK